MWPWTKRAEPPDDLRTRVADLESEMRRIRVEWKDTLDRLLRVEDRQRKRQERSEAASEGQDTPADRKRLLRLRVREQHGTRS